MPPESVSHKGMVVSVTESKVNVEIISRSACSACQVAGLCGVSEAEKKIIEVPAENAPRCTVGQEVEVCLAKRTGLKAVLFSYVIPVLILLIIIVSLSSANLSELAIGLASVVGVAAYYFIVYLFRNRLAGRYEFYIIDYQN